MQLGLAISTLVHLGLLAWAYLIMLQTPKLEPPEPEPITVALITPSDLLRLKQGSETATELEAKAKEEPKPVQSQKEAEKPKPVEAPTLPEEPPPPPAEAAKPPDPPKPEPKQDPIADKIAALPPEQAPGPTPEELQKIEDQKRAADEARQAEEEKRKADDKKKAEEKKKEDEKKKAEEAKKKELEKKKAEEAKKKKDLAKKQTPAADRLAALLDKDPSKRGAPTSALPPTKDTTYTGPTAGANQGTDTVLSAREQDLLRGQISAQLRGCWKLPGGGGGIETTVVTIKWHLMQDGSLDGEPATQAPQSGPVYQIAAEAAIRAVKQCSPFTLPIDQYAAWKTIIWDFDPREMM